MERHHLWLSGGIGILGGLKNLWRKPCGFESHLSHHFNADVLELAYIIVLEAMALGIESSNLSISTIFIT